MPNVHAAPPDAHPSVLSLTSEGLGLTLIPGNVVPATFDGLLLRHDPLVNRHRPSIPGCDPTRLPPLSQHPSEKRGPLLSMTYL